MRIAQHLISGGTQTKAPPSIAAHIASNAIDFFRVMKKSQLLPLNAADRAWSNPIGIEKGGEHQSQILSFKRRTTCPLKRGRSRLPSPRRPPSEGFLSVGLLDPSVRAETAMDLPGS